MQKELDISIQPDFINDTEYHKKLASKKLRKNPAEISAVKILKRSIDSRGKNVVYRLKILVYINETPKEDSPLIRYLPVESDKFIVIVGSGPAGLFAALRSIELGIRPIIIERGKDVRARRWDLKSVMRDGVVNPDSNYCFGEGGAGTYSDGKLYTRSNKRGDVGKILNVLVHHGADNNILIDSHPHIGSNKLPKIIQSIRETIINCGGEVKFNSLMTDLIIKDNKIRGIIINNNQEIISDSVILATGHSARDIYYLLNKHNLAMEAKPFALGVRIEHPQSLIDSIQYHSKHRHENLPASNYSLSCQVDRRGVYSFCMCPGGIIIPASTENNELVLNGMSVSKRNSPYANSGLVVEVNQNDWKKYSKFGNLASLMYQIEFEKKAYIAGGGNQKAPAQRITDFIKRKISSDLPATSYIPGTVSHPVHEFYPREITNRLRKALFNFDSKMKGYITHESQFLAAETRTSSPVRITRNPETLMHVGIEGLFPCGEGAGYAGGIVSAAIDGERCAEAISKVLN